ncbi:hypothetical protein GCM10011387_26320 [Pedobacter quisquiliarum]|uniref:Uncharacterized protein n=1 Tax=Pedobacter quisquiliarum TaxID=1834438 RepID=A0A916XH58_9SPHI|nr:hypothetical protein GCM10011387_26320 [Pedobacter quisquiliarum]
MKTGSVSVGYDVNKFFHLIKGLGLQLIKLVYNFALQINITNFIGTIILTILVQTNIL